MSESPRMEGAVVQSATLKSGVRRVTFRRVPHEPGVAARIFGAIGGESIKVGDIIQSISEAGRNVTVSFTVEAQRLEAAQAVAEQVAKHFKDVDVEVSDELARLRVVGMGMRAHTGIAAKLFQALAAEKINIENISTSEIVISVLVPVKDGERALEATLKAFDLEKQAD